MRFHDEGLVEFNRLREKRLQTLPLDLLAMTPMTQSSESEERLPITSEIAEETQTKEQERKEKEKIQRKEQHQSSMDMNVDVQIDPKLLQEWQQLDSIIRNLESSKEANTSKAVDTQDLTSTEVPSGTSGQPPSTGKEIIPKGPSYQIIFQVEDIPPLDVFYSPKHRSVVKR